MSDRERQLEELLGLVEKVYAAAIDETAWPGMAGQIASVFRSTSTNLLVPVRGSHSPQSLCVTENIDAASRLAYSSYYSARDVWVDRAIGHGMPAVVASKDLVEDAEFSETEFYRDWCRHLDVFYVMGSVFRTGADELSVLGIHRPKSAGTYSENDKTLAALFVPHLQRALRVRKSLATSHAQRTISLAALEHIDSALFILDACGRVLFNNRRAEALLRRGDGITLRNGRVSAVDVASAARLAELIRAAGDLKDALRPCGGALRIPRAGDTALEALVSHFRLALSGEGISSVILLVRDPNCRALDADVLRSLFDLTATEAQITRALANGSSIAEIAADHHARPQTVRKQLKQIFAKTGTRRQAELVALALRSVAALALG
jgi:DNA-binding CsgD family transcriptional regulator/PAS domain-containing protein